MSQAMRGVALNTTQQNRRHIVSFSSNRYTGSLAAAKTVLCTARSVGNAEERASEAFGSAARLYEDGHWKFAFDRLSPLADRGHAPAAKLALLMLRYGSALYGTNFSAKPEQVAQWAQRVLRATSRPTASPSSITASA